MTVHQFNRIISTLYTENALIHKISLNWSWSWYIQQLWGSDTFTSSCFHPISTQISFFLRDDCNVASNFLIYLWNLIKYCSLQVHQLIILLVHPPLTQDQGGSCLLQFRLQSVCFFYHWFRYGFKWWFTYWLKFRSVPLSTHWPIRRFRFQSLYWFDHWFGFWFK